MYSDFIKISHPAYDFYDETMYYGVLVPNSKEIVMNSILKKKAVKTSVSFCVDDNFNLLSKEDMINKGVYIVADLNSDFNGCSINQLNNIKSKQIKPVLKDELYSKIIKTIKKYCYFASESEYDIIACYIIGSYFYRLFSYFPILHFYAERGSGKTVAAKIIEFLGWNSYYTLNITKAGLSRVNSQRRGVVIIDEKENINDNDDLKLILNGCFQRGSKEVLTEKNKDGNYEVVYFELYAPVVIASINPIYGATSDRIIRIEMDRHKVESNIFEHQDDKSWQKIRDDLFIFGLTTWKEIKNNYETYSCDFLQNRDLDIWKSLLSMYSFFKNDDELSKYIKKSYFSYKQDVQEFSYSSLLCDYIIQNMEDKSLCQSSELFMKFKESLRCDKFLFEHISQTMFGSIMRRIGYTGDYKQHSRNGNAYIISHALCKSYNSKYFYKNYGGQDE